MAHLNVAKDTAALAQDTALRIAQLLQAAIARSGSARLCLTGGSTPRDTYRALAHPRASELVPWPQVEFFWGDERHVPPDHPDSNFGMAQDTLLRPLSIPDAQIHRMRGEHPDAAVAASEYDVLLRERRAARRPLFDVMLLGLGADAHIASLFPGSEWLDAQPSPVTADDAADPESRERRAGTSPLAAAVRKPDDGAWRITLTPAALLDAAAIVVITAGASKADAVFAAMQGPSDPLGRPAQLLRDAEGVEWWMDAAAAQKLSR